MTVVKSDVWFRSVFFSIHTALIQIYLILGVTKIKDVVYIIQKTDVKCDAEFDLVPTSLVLMP